jgi:GNAT superfamily N-acetyltransferase
MAIIRPTTCSVLFQEPNIKVLLDEYAAECSITDLGSISPQCSTYDIMEATGGLQAFGVYDGVMLVGFAVVLIYTLPHYGKRVATTESIFLSKDHRHGDIGGRLLLFIESYAKSKGCIAFLYSAPAGSQFDHLLATNVDRYRNTSNVYLRSLA